jgi:hypothetical protein
MRSPSLTMQLIYGRSGKSGHCGILSAPQTRSSSALALTCMSGFFARKIRLVNRALLEVLEAPWCKGHRRPLSRYERVRGTSGLIAPSSSWSRRELRTSPAFRLRSTSSPARLNLAVMPWCLVGNPIEASGWHTDVGSEPKDWEMCSREVAAGFYWLRELLRLIGSIM